MDYDTEDLLVRDVKGVTIVRLKIENLNDPQTLSRIQSEVLTLLENGAAKLVLDFKYVRYASSAALGMLIAVRQKVLEKRARLILSHPEHIEELLRISNTAKLFETADDPKVASQRF